MIGADSDMVTIGPLAIFGWFGAILLVVLVIGWALSKVMPPADYPHTPWPTPPRFPPGKVGEFMAEEELRKRIEANRERPVHGVAWRGTDDGGWEPVTAYHQPPPEATERHA